MAASRPLVLSPVRQATARPRQPGRLDAVDPTLSLKDVLVDVLRIILQILLVLTSAFLTLLVLMHKGKGGGLSDMFGGGLGASAAGSTVVEKNLDRITVVVALVFTLASVALALLLNQ